MKAMERQNNGIIRSLERQEATFGMTANELALYKLQMNGATDAVMRNAQSLAFSIESQQRHHALLAKGKELTDQLRTPVQKYSDRLGELRTMLAGGVISQETFNKAVSSAGNEMLGAGSIANKLSIAFAAAAAGVAYFAARVIGGVESTTDMASQLGVATEALTRLQFAADINGSSADAMSTALGKMNQNLGNATDQAGPTATALAQLGLNAQNLISMSPDQAFMAIADSISQVKNPAQRAALAVDIFGKSGQNIINVLSMGSKGIRDFGEQSDKVGATLTSGTAASIARAKDAIDEMLGSLRGLSALLISGIAPAIATVAGWVTKLIGWFKAMATSSGSVASSLMKWVVALGIGLTLAPLVVGAILTIIKAFRSMAIAQTLILALQGPKGWATLAAAAAVAGVAAYATKKAFDGLEKSLSGTNAAAPQAAGSIVDAARKAQEAAAKSAELTNAIDATTKSLQDQVDSFGLTGAALEIFKLKQQGATDAQLTGAQAAADLLDALNRESAVLQVLSDLQNQSDNFGKSADDLTLMKLAAEGATHAQLQLAAALLGTLDAAKKQAAVNQTLSDLHDQVSNFGQSEKALTLMKLATEGATEAQLALAGSILDTLDAAKKQQAMMDRGKQVTESVMTPTEKLKSQLDDLTELYKNGAITRETFARAAAQAMDAANPKAKEVELPKGPEAVVRRFTEGGPVNRNKVEDYAKTTAVETAKQTSLISQMINSIDALQGSPTPINLN